MSKASLENEIRSRILSQIFDIFKNDDSRYISNGEIMVPVLDSDGNERYAVIKVTIPRGTRNGAGGYNEYNGYEAADEWKRDKEETEAKEKAKKEAKAIAEAEKARKRRARAKKPKNETSE